MKHRRRISLCWHLGGYFTNELLQGVAGALSLERLGARVRMAMYLSIYSHDSLQRTIRALLILGVGTPGARRTRQAGTLN